jgi:peptide chain release factor 1
MNPKLDQLAQKNLQEMADVETQLQDPAVLADQAKLVPLSRRHSELRKIGELHQQLLAAEHERDDLRATMGHGDTELVAMATEELPAAEQKCLELEQALAASLTPPDPADSRGVVLELRAGTGGDEAGLFGAQLLAAPL